MGENILKILTFAKPVTDSFLVDIIYWLVTITASIWAGIILFTLILKLITLPFDYISRASMRKNNIIMEKMRPELEKLQKQYADNKDLYNQKMMALYKKNGYSALGACLPTILTLVIFIVAVNAFGDYSGFQNRQYFYDMSNAYNSVVYDGFEADNEFIIKQEDGSVFIDIEKLNGELGEEVSKEIQVGEHSIIVTKGTNENGKANITVKTSNGYTQYENVYASVETIKNGTVTYTVIENGLLNSALTNENGLTYAEAKQANAELTATDYITGIRRERSANSFRTADMKFLWIKNIWVTDTPTKNPIQSDWESFKTEHDYKDDSDTFTSADYNELIYNLSDEKEAPNGYFILIALVIGLNVLSQFVNMKISKAQMELQTVDGQGVATQKMMMWMMPIMMAVFAFIYTAAFSLYIILSTALSLLSTFAINAIVDKKYKHLKEEPKKEIIRGRVYVKKEEPATTSEKVKKGKETPKNDFLSGLADKKKKKK